MMRVSIYQGKQADSYSYLFVELDEILKNLTFDRPIGNLFDVFEFAQKRSQVGDVV